ncbi:hypothetical protein ACWD5R_41015 [Streptomyces sp. NPDC002514]|uniref:hypothetical protein n=1 Tax=Streptomyces sp. NPDC001270 TaxID=3364554 RepID=UPI0036AAC4E8
MTALLSSRHTWRLHLSEAPLPAMLSRETDVVHVGMGLGMAALDAMIDAGKRVGPLLCCIAHRQLRVPVESGTADLWWAPHSVCEAGQSLRCSEYGARSGCQNRFWVIPPEPRACPTTDPGILHDRLSLVRAQLRDADRYPMGLRAQEMCHV